MSTYQDFGQYIMKLFDPLISESKKQITEETNNFLRELPQKFSGRTSVSVTYVENNVREIAEKLLRINQDILNDYSITIAKKTRSAIKKRTSSNESELNGLKEQLSKREEELEGLKSRIKFLEEKNKNLEFEKQETLKQYDQMLNTIKTLESKLENANREFETQITALNTEWQTRFEK
ncbi:MAG: hypothetical protein ACTSW1_08940, partial [Candidatus Hodarchaeales archaeon]